MVRLSKLWLQRVKEDGNEGLGEEEEEEEEREKERRNKKEVSVVKDSLGWVSIDCLMGLYLADVVAGMADTTQVISEGKKRLGSAN